MDNEDIARELGYLTRAVADQGKDIASLTAYVTTHMDKEEQTINRIYKWLVFLTIAVVTTQGAGMDWSQILSLVTKL